MTNNEFKAWFEGFNEGIEKTPTAKQWAKIQEKINLIDGSLSFTQYVTRYINPSPFYSALTVTPMSTTPMTMNTITASGIGGHSSTQTASEMIASIGRQDFASAI